MVYQAYDAKEWRQESYGVQDRWDRRSDDAPQQKKRFETVREATRQQAFSGMSWLLDIVVPNCG